MTIMKPVARLLFTCVLGLTVALLMLNQTVVPLRDLIASFAGLAIVTEILKYETHGKESQVHDSTPARRRLYRFFYALSGLEVLCTLLVPWALILEEVIQETGETVIFILAPHLFIFQVQIGLECLLLGGSRRDMVFPFTLSANAYRFLPLMTWVSRTGFDMRTQATNQQQMHYALALIGLGLWLYSSFYFIPCEWWPVLQQESKRRQLYEEVAVNRT